MKEGPDIALLGAMIGDPARANMLIALMSGKALTATEMASEAGITVQTASSHLSKLESAGLLQQRKQGRHRYFTLADDDVAEVLESLMGLAARRGLMRTRTGPKDPALRHARVCYNHLAGDLGVQLFHSLRQRDLLVGSETDFALTDAGRAFLDDMGIDVSALERERRPVCKSCLDWSERRTHMAGALGTAMLERFMDLGWARRVPKSRVISFSPKGQKAFEEHFPTIN
ncbi:MAG: winged helix-turn-helix domain-containing protein [Minwuia sp.]|nr:winged helix-turn-helix domain-containing protein [Minwuia sp.]